LESESLELTWKLDVELEVEFGEVGSGSCEFGKLEVEVEGLEVDLSVIHFNFQFFINASPISLLVTESKILLKMAKNYTNLYPNHHKGWESIISPWMLDL